MDAPFPFGLPWPTRFYLTLYLLTLMIHIVFMNYVLAGSAYLAVHSVVHGGTESNSPIAALLRDWMPFMLSAAITAGVAPLLFLQVLYKQQFYTANLLLFSRWMAILPVLIAGFYLAYLLKSKLVHCWPLVARAAVGCGVFACFAFVGWSWVENHLLSVQPQATWSGQYASEAILFRSGELLPRLTLWFLAAFPTLALVIGWQLLYRARGTASDEPRASRSSQAVAPGDPTAVPGSRRTCLLALSGIVLSSVAAGVYFAVMNEAARNAITGRLGCLYLLLAVGGGLIQAVAWAAQYRRGSLSRGWLKVASGGLAVNFVGMAVVNEATRLAALDVSSLYQLHERASRVGGLFLFVLFLVVNSSLMAYCMRLVRRGSRSSPASEGGA